MTVICNGYRFAQDLVGTVQLLHYRSLKLSENRGLGGQVDGTIKSRSHGEIVLSFQDGIDGESPQNSRRFIMKGTILWPGRHQSVTLSD